MSQKSKSFIWKQTIDGQLQPFNLQSSLDDSNEKQGVYKPSSYKPCDQVSNKLIKIQTPVEFQTSTNVWTSQGYGVIKSISKGVVVAGESQDKEENDKKEQQKTLQVKLMACKQKNNKEDQIISVKSSNAQRKITINGRIIGGQKLELIKLEQVPILTKVESLIDKISAMKNQPTYLIAAFAKSHSLDKKKSLVEEQIGNNDFIIFSLNSGKMNVFKRFKEMSTSYWYIGSSWDAISFKSTKALLVMGFGTYQHYHSATFNIKFNVFDNDKNVLTVDDYKINGSQVKEKIGQVKFKNPIRIAAGSKLTIQMMHKQVSGQSNHAYYGNSGDNAQTINGNDTFITVHGSDKDQNCSSTSSGQIPQLYYIAG